MLPCFQIVGIVFCEYEKFAMFVSACMPCGPRWMSCRLLILSGPTAAECLRFLMICFVCCGVNGVYLGSVGNCLLCLMTLLSLWLGVR